VPLQDHYQPPLSGRRHWQAFHNAWATKLAEDLNLKLPERYFAEPNVQFGIEIDVATLKDGEYEFSLRRWPVEADAGLAAALPPVQVTDGEYPAGKSLPIARARLSVAGFDEARPVGSEDRAATFSVRLDAGPARVQTWFYDSQGRELCGAYYLYIRRR
jgi:hypothetical protein